LEKAGQQQTRDTSSQIGVVAAGIVYVIVCVLLVSYGLPLLDLVVVMIVMGVPVDLIRRRSYVRERRES